MIPAIAALAIAGTRLRLESPAFANGARLPVVTLAADCGGRGRSPALRWHGVPTGTRSFVLLLHDPDAPMPGGYTHWVIYDLPAKTRALPAAVVLPKGEVGMASTGRAAYAGPCPPPGPAHHYVFTLFALDIARVPGERPLRENAVVHAIAGHILASTTIVGLAATSDPPKPH